MIIVCAIPAGAQARKLQVPFIVTDCWGGKIPDASVQLTPAKGAPILFRHPVTRHIELDTGPYTVRIHAQGFMTWERAITITGSPLLIASCLTLAPIESGPKWTSSLSGSVSYRPRTETNRWVRLIGMYSDYNAASPVNESGKFRFDNLNPGRYFIMLFTDGRVTSSREIDIRIFENTMNIE